MEWVRDDVLKKRFERLTDYFPPGASRSVRDRWKEVAISLHAEGRFRHEPDFNSANWREFIKLHEYRNGLVHGSSSRPDLGPDGGKSNPNPSKQTLDAIAAGWAVRTAAAVMVDLHTLTESTAPSWLVSP